MISECLRCLLQRRTAGAHNVLRSLWGARLTAQDIDVLVVGNPSRSALDAAALEADPRAACERAFPARLELSSL